MFEPIVWTYCLNTMCELTSNIDLENHVPILEIQHRLGKSCSHVGNPTLICQAMFHFGKSQTSIWKAMYAFWKPNIDLNIHVPIDTRHRFGCEYSHVGHPTACYLLWLMFNIQVTLLNKYVEHKSCVLDVEIRSVGPLGVYMYIHKGMYTHILYTCVYIYIYIYIHMWHMCICMRMCVYIYIYIYTTTITIMIIIIIIIITYVYIYIYTYAHTHTHYTHTYTI